MHSVLARPTPHEDETLRRLHFFERFGFSLSPQMKHLKHEIRVRDRRAEIRQPAHVVVTTPLWST